jgi:hypothetical protein
VVGASNSKIVNCSSILITPPTQKESPHSDQNYIQLTFYKATKRKVALRCAAYLAAIERIAGVYRYRGLFP